MKELYTIGHSSHNLNYFLYLLRKFRVNSVVDIRSVPFSKYVPHFNKDKLKNFLSLNHIYYIYMAKEFGLIQEDISLFHPEGYLDFNKMAKTELFKRGIQRLKIGVDKGYKIAIMCAEKDPLDCHRSILISPALIKEGYSVTHILPDSKIETHKEFEDRLLNLYFPQTPQQNFFHLISQDNSKYKLLNMAYILRNKDIINNGKMKNRIRS
ncbi:DUF488 family protein [Clostridium bovifaecis]|uniref:DUF488 family protein n=1 Tax=Clostridium bovifaecis TaxID=2184719 RepID=A0A6I6ET84_9CLOT|nr:DUF488 family protein [Clostridium bovifaecis]